MDPIKSPESSESKLHFLDYWRIIRIRKTVIIIVFLLVMITTTAITLLMSKTYASYARISIDKDKVDVEGLNMERAVSGYDPFFLQTEFEKITSQVVLDEVIRLLELQPKWSKRYLDGDSLSPLMVRKYLKSSLQVKLSRNTSLVEIWAYSEDKDEAAQLANTVAEVYKDSRLMQRRELKEKGVQVLQTQLEKRKLELAELQANLNEIRKTNEITFLDDSGVSSFQMLQTTELQRIQMEKQGAAVRYDAEQIRLKQIEDQDREQLRNSMETIVQDPTLTKLAQDYAVQVQALTAIKQNKSEEHPQVLERAQVVEKIQTQLDDKIAGIIQGLKVSAAISKATLDNLTAELKQQEEKSTDLRAKLVTYSLAKDTVDEAKRIISALKLRVEQESIEMQLPMESVVTVHDKAFPDTKPVRPNVYLNLILGVVVGLVLGVGLAFFIEYLDTSVKTIDDVERALQAPVLAVIPQNVGTILFEGPESPHAEAYRVLRTNILFARKDPSWNAATVVSGGAGEGKSTTLFNLATIFAQNGSRVLVVDSDLRRPSIHKIINVSNNIGLTNYLLKQNSLEEVIQRTTLATLDVMPSGKLPSSSMGILSSPQMKGLISELKRRYDFVFFDSPPIMGISDAAVLASEVDMVVQVIQYRRYPQPMTIRAKQMIQKVGGNLLGVVLNNINMSQDENYYYYSGYYYDYYSKQDDDDEDSSKKKASEKAGVPANGRLEIKGKY
jgi:capsular exopolysaccharide synthesis family protein